MTTGAATAVANDRIRDHAERRVVPANANNWACAAAQQFHHASLLDAGVRILEYPAMLHAKAFVRDGEELLAGTCKCSRASRRCFEERKRPRVAELRAKPARSPGGAR